MVLITGASGLVGCALVKELVEKNEKIRVFLQKEEKHKKALEKLIKDENLEQADIEYFYGDIRDKPSLKPALEGISELYHLAVFMAIIYFTGQESLIPL